LLRQHLNRALLYEALAVVPAAIVTAGLLLPIEAAARRQTEVLRAEGTRRLDSGDIGQMALRAELDWVSPTRRLVQGVAVAPLAAFLAVANVFIYLNLRYEQEPRRR
jgi:hypothetical protein